MTKKLQIIDRISRLELTHKMTKSELRKIYLERQKNLAPVVRQEKSRSIADKFFAGFDLSGVKFLHCFLPIEKFNEIDTRLIFNCLWKNFPHIQTLAPRIDFQTSEMTSLIFNSRTTTTTNDWNIEEPAKDELVAAEKIDLILVPLLCYDLRGFRVGYGKGFYDRFLKTCRADCLKIGLSYFPPIREIADANDLDVKLDFFIKCEV